MGDARYGRRDNGLVAAEYAPAGDVDPRVGEHLLDVLARDGIAAYLRPSSDQYSATRSTTLPQRPVDRLYVDRAHLATARDHLARLAREEREAEEAADRRPAGGPPGARADTPTGAVPNPRSTGPKEPSPEEVDRAFAEIVAGLGVTTAPDAVTGRPDGTESGTGLPHPSRPDRRRSEPERAPEEGSLLDALDTFGAHLPDDPGEFVPPEPPPVPRPALPTVLAVIGVVGGLAVFLQPRLLPFFTESLAMFVGFAMVVGGSATLVWRLRPGGDDDPDPDQGARV